MFRDYEERLLSEIDKRLTVTLSKLNNLSERVSALETDLQELKNTASEKLIAQAEKNNKLGKEVEALKKYVRNKANSAVSDELRVNGIPQYGNEDLFAIYRKICEVIRIDPPTVKEIFRVKMKKNKRYTNMCLYTLIRGKMPHL